MKRDMDLVRQLLLRIEEGNGPSMSEILEKPEDQEEQELYGHHTRILIDEGFLTGIDASSMSSTDWLDLQLTWKGHEFLDTLRDPTIWEKSKKLANKAGGSSLQILLEIGKSIVVEAAKEQLKKLGAG